jgi:tRNA nucleotidyltransferase/poly(A) polymerase
MSDYMFVLESHLDAGQSRAVAEVQRIATEAGMNVWLTGGAMRDVLRGARIRDLDFTVEHDAVKTGKALALATGGIVVSEDPLKRCVELSLPGATPGDTRASVSNTRTEKYSKAGGKPQIGPATIHEDLMRRDFTINAIALSLNRGSRGLLIDPANGQADLTGRELRATNPYIFLDDPSRIFRLIRFEHALGFQIAPRLQLQLENALSEGYQESATASALAAEIRALAGEVNAVPALEEFERLGLLKLISPALTGAKLNTAGLTKFEKLAHSVLPSGTPGGHVAFLNILLEKLNPHERADVLRAFDLSKTEAETLKRLDGQAKKLETNLKSPRVTRPSHVYQTLEGVPADEILMVLYNSPHRVVQDRIRAYYEKYLAQAQEVTEEQVAATGVKPGTPKFEKAYRAMLTAHLNARPRKVVPPEGEGAVGAVAGGPNPGGGPGAPGSPPQPPPPQVGAGRGLRK